MLPKKDVVISHNLSTKLNLCFYQVAEPKLLFGTIKDWFEKHDTNTNLDTAASNLQFYVQDIHRHIGKTTCPSIVRAR